ncbi:MAG TPA: aconitate hydratase AcnA, partial [Acidimicrobiales bacterium]|nr:aconitate hydratase AcnA [Acidimicrobiales bacterium]
MRSNNSFGARGDLQLGQRRFSVYRLDRLAEREGFDVAYLPFSLKVLLENLLRHEDGLNVTPESIAALASWATSVPGQGSKARAQIAFSPARILLQDFTGVPVVADLAAMRDAMVALGGDAAGVQPQVPAELVIDHSVIADFSGRPDAFSRNSDLEFQRNGERYRFLRWGQQAFGTLKVVPPNTGICHQVNLEHLARVVFATDEGEAFPDTQLGTDSHTTMVNGLGVLAWGVGGIEAEAAMLGEPVTMLIPDVVGFRLTGELPEGSTATDLVLSVTELLRKHGVVGKFVEFYGDGVAKVALYNRATIGNMSPEYGSTCAIFPIDQETLRYLRFTGRSEEQVALVEAYAKSQGLWHDASVEPVYSERLELDLSTVEPSLAGPARPQDRVPLRGSKVAFREALAKILGKEAAAVGADRVRVGTGGTEGTDGYELGHGDVVIAAITSCTNTSNPEVMVAAGLLAKHAVERGLSTRPWVKTSLAPGSKVVMDYYERAGLTPYLDKLGFELVGYGCTTCIGNSGPLLPGASDAVAEGGLAVVSVLSGNRNFEGRINPDVRMNYLASPPLVVAYAIAGSMDFDITGEPLGTGADGRPVYLRDIWPSSQEVAAVISEAIAADMFEKSYAEVFEGDERWAGLEVPQGERYEWGTTSTYVRQPPYFGAMPDEPAPLRDIHGARALAKLGDSVTTDHISPAGSIRKESPAGQWLIEHGVTPADFNSYGSRRGNHEVMVRGTFANVRLRNQLAPGTEGGVTTFFPTGKQMTIYEAAVSYSETSTPLVVLAGKEYGSGSSRDWAAKGTALLGVRAVIAESFERIHRSNLVGMGVLPLQFRAGESAQSLGLTGEEVFDISGLEAAGDGPLPEVLWVSAGSKAFDVVLRIDTPVEAEYYRHGGILPYVVRHLHRRA